MMLGEYGEYWTCKIRYEMLNLYRMFLYLKNIACITVRNVSAVETGIFFWSFIVIISMILFNMVLAVILTVYEDKYKEVAVDFTNLISMTASCLFTASNILCGYQFSSWSQKNWKSRKYC